MKEFKTNPEVFIKTQIQVEVWELYLLQYKGTWTIKYVDA